MRLIWIAASAAVLASCTTAPPEPMRSADKQHDYELLLAGKVAQAPISCLPHFRDNDMRVIDDSTIAYRDGNNRTYVTHMLASCNDLSSGHYALVQRKHGTPDTCRGDIAEVVDLMSRTMVGSCVFGDFTPYVKPRA